MAANLVYRHDYIAPNSGVSVFIHGYPNNQAVSYSGSCGAKEDSNGNF